MKNSCFNSSLWSGEMFLILRKGNIIVRSDGSDTWEDSPAGKQGYVVYENAGDQLENSLKR